MCSGKGEELCRETRAALASAPQGPIELFRNTRGTSSRVNQDWVVRASRSVHLLSCAEAAARSASLRVRCGILTLNKKHVRLDAIVFDDEAAGMGVGWKRASVGYVCLSAVVFLVAIIRGWMWSRCLSGACSMCCRQVTQNRISVIFLPRSICFFFFKFCDLLGEISQPRSSCGSRRVVWLSGHSPALRSPRFPSDGAQRCALHL